MSTQPTDGNEIRGVVRRRVMGTFIRARKPERSAS